MPRRQQAEHCYAMGVSADPPVHAAVCRRHGEAAAAEDERLNLRVAANQIVSCVRKWCRQLFGAIASVGLQTTASVCRLDFSVMQALGMACCYRTSCSLDLLGLPGNAKGAAGAKGINPVIYPGPEPNLTLLQTSF